MLRVNLKGVLLGYGERQGGDGKTYHDVKVFDGDSGVPVPFALDAAPNGNALPSGTLVEVEAEMTVETAVIGTAKGRHFAAQDRVQLRRLRAVAIRKATEPARAAA